MLVAGGEKPLQQVQRLSWSSAWNVVVSRELMTSADENEVSIGFRKTDLGWRTCDGRMR